MSTMRTHTLAPRPTSFFLILSLLLPALGGARTSATPLPHFALEKSRPAANDTVTAVSEVRLWFTEEPEEGTVSIRVLDAADEVVATGDVTQDPDDPKALFVPLNAELTPGTYRVAWRGMGDDGHVVRGSFRFTVRAGVEPGRPR